MSTLVPSVLSTDPARGGGEHTQLYHTPDGNGRASAPEGVDVAAGSAGFIPLAKSDAKLKKSNWLGEAMDTVVKAFQGDKDPTRTRSAGGSAAEDESRDLGGPSNFSATATATMVHSVFITRMHWDCDALGRGCKDSLQPCA
ncbi:hypothetical protein AB1Y20_023007 [Prymnesium parvum]|uniref:Uncharacterized protein n=1 Tax=Prymnesium parvum TaxID=97485 RepID=A0AB34JFU4_PRYPA